MPGQGQVVGEHRAKVRLVVDDDQLGHGIAIPSSAKVFSKRRNHIIGASAQLAVARCLAAVLSPRPQPRHN